MRLVLSNPQGRGYGKLVGHTLFRKKQIVKYSYFLDYLKDKSKSTAIYIDGTATSLSVIGIRFVFFPKFFSFLELMLWMIANKVNPFQNRIYFNSNKLQKNDILVDSCRRVNSQSIGFKGVHLILFTHYFLNAEKTAEKLKLVKNLLPVAENDLTSNSFFRAFFPFIKQVYQLPFIFGDRFRSNVKFSERKNQCFAIGTIAPVDEKNSAFLNFFGYNILQPMRKTIHAHSENYPQEINSKITMFENFSTMDKSSIKKSRFGRFLLKYCPLILKIVYSNKHKKYFKFDIVAEFNSHKMFTCPEEVIGLPSINVFEGMACGCAFIGIDDPMYTNLGLVPGVHYVAHKKDDLNDLIEKIRYYQKKPALLEEIAEKGCEFVRKNFNPKNVADVLWNDLEIISRNFLQSNNVNISCSFTKK